MKILSRLFRTRDYDSLSLCELVFLTVDAPSQGTTDALIKRLTTSKVYAIPTNSFLAKAEGGDVEPIVRQKGPDGNVCFVIFCDLDTIQREYPNETVVELPGVMVMQIAHDAKLPVAIRARRGSQTPYTVLPVSTSEAIYSTIPKYEGSYNIRIYRLGLR